MTFNTIFGSNTSFQEEIHSGKLIKKYFYIGLQNKCLYEYDLYDKNVFTHYEIIWLRLWTTKIFTKHILNFRKCLSV